MGWYQEADEYNDAYGADGELLRKLSLLAYEIDLNFEVPVFTVISPRILSFSVLPMIRIGKHCRVFLTFQIDAQVAILSNLFTVEGMIWGFGYLNRAGGVSQAFQVNTDVGGILQSGSGMPTADTYSGIIDLILI
jgi:hypothetical protein